MTEPAIAIRAVSKRFRINSERYTSLKERVVHLGRRGTTTDFWALRDIDLDVGEGETVGLLGHNGSGKSTLLKCVGGILRPTEGEIRTRGRVASLLELGAGFHPELTGRENVFLNASILGLPRRDIERRFDEIVDFSELSQFIDQQVKHYSSGMYVRLGFAVATNVDPDVLLVDEVLAVGDEAFQQKCLERVRRFQQEGRTIVFVTHAPDLVRQICDRAMVLDHGRQVTVDEPLEAIRTFRERLLGGSGGGSTVLDTGEHRAIRVLSKQVRIVDVKADWPGAGERAFLRPGEPLRVHLRYEAPEPVDDVVFALNIHDTDEHLVYGCNTDVLGQGPDRVHGTGWVTFAFSAVPLLDGEFVVSLGAHTHDVRTQYDYVEEAFTFEVMTSTRVVGLVALDAKVTTDGPSR
ncbi:MAG TPA: ABC transporter ATP-binding protein [Acidimicrobiales bacterium]